jgi:putative sterol carrier protein
MCHQVIQPFQVGISRSRSSIEASLPSLAADYIKIVAGKVNTPTALMMGKRNVTGDMPMSLK